MCENFNILSHSDFYSRQVSINYDSTSVNYEQTDEQEFACFASLVHSGISLDPLDCVEKITLRGVSLYSIPADHLVSLFSSVTSYGYSEVTIDNVDYFDLETILDSIKGCNFFSIKNQVLTLEYTEAIERARERCTNVEPHVDDPEYEWKRGRLYSF